MVILLVVVALISMTVMLAAGMLAIFEMLWPLFAVAGVIVLTLWLLDRFGVLPQKGQRPKKRYRRKK